MPITFNANEIFEMAEEIERNGAKFYRKAAENTSDEETKKMLLDMADMEDGHLATFKEMREQFSGQAKGWTVFDPDNQSVLYLQTMADARGYEGKITPNKELTGNETTKEILDIALNSEKESVVFYFGLKGMVPVKAGRDKVEAIIIEELSHITTLLKQLKSL
ncbi:MAG: ferritin family protein [Sedimentisphaerales bacterium]|nr:ferritin family protein [Sedimentisphaerales bacterium]